MNEQSNPEKDERLPKEDELWTILNDGIDDSRFAVGRVLDTTVGDDHDLLIDVEVLYDSYDFIDTPNQMWEVDECYFHAPLPEHDEMDEKFEDCLDTLLGYFSPAEVAKILDANPSHRTAGRRGYEAARFVILDGVSESITEFSVGHGHGPSRYGNALASRVSDLPEWLAESALYSERERWEGGMPFDAEAASYLVEVLLVENEILDKDNDDDITELVNRFDLEYDEYHHDEI